MAQTKRRTKRATMTSAKFAELFDRAVDNCEQVIKGKTDAIRLALVALFAEGHVLFEDVPGVGKSMLARTLGKTIEADVSRIQCTPDMLPGDITGSAIFDQRDRSFAFQPGPVFTNILLADEINRATPKTQSALLEAMAERTVTVDGTSHPLPRPFLVLATQNPIELAGTFPLPEAQLDRFLFKLSMGYPGEDAEAEVLRSQGDTHPVETLEPVLTRGEVREMSVWAKGVSIADEVLAYMIAVCRATRDEPSFQLGAGPRASLALMWASRVLAASQGREDVYPDDVEALIRPVLAHRLILTPDATMRGEDAFGVLERVTSGVKAPMSRKRR